MSAEGGVIYGGYLRNISCKGQEIGAKSAFHDNVRGRPFFMRRGNDTVTAQRERDKTAFGGACQRKAVLFTAGMGAYSGKLPRPMRRISAKSHKF